MRVKRIALATAAGVAMAALSVIWAARQRPGTDFYAKWIAGRWFFTGHPLYVHVPGLRDATYPPFAAFAFQLFALFPLKAAAALFYFANLVFIPVAVLLTRRVADAYWPGRNRARWPLVAAVVLSAQFILNNLNLIQIDLGLLVLVLAGLAWYAEGRDVRAATALVVAAAIKLIPIFWVGWLILRGRRRAALAVLPLGAAGLLLPVAQRGPRQGMQDLKDFYGFVLQGFQHGRVIMTYTNQDLSGAVYRLLRPSADSTDGDYRLLAASEGTAQIVSRVSAGLLLAAFVGCLIWLRLRGAPVTMFELASVFLIGHLLSAMTWKSHLVTLLFVLYPFLALPFRELPRPLRWSVYAVLTLAAIVGLTGRDVVGDTLHHAIGGYSLIAWMLVALFVLSLVLSLRSHLVNPDRA